MKQPWKFTRWSHWPGSATATGENQGRRKRAITSQQLQLKAEPCVFHVFRSMHALICRAAQETGFTKISSPHAILENDAFHSTACFTSHFNTKGVDLELQGAAAVCRRAFWIRSSVFSQTCPLTQKGATVLRRTLRQLWL